MSSCKVITVRWTVSVIDDIAIRMLTTHAGRQGSSVTNAKQREAAQRCAEVDILASATVCARFGDWGQHGRNFGRA